MCVCMYVWIPKAFEPLMGSPSYLAWSFISTRARDSRGQNDDWWWVKAETDSRSSVKRLSRENYCMNRVEFLCVPHLYPGAWYVGVNTMIDDEWRQKPTAASWFNGFYENTTGHPATKLDLPRELTPEHDIRGSNQACYVPRGRRGVLRATPQGMIYGGQTRRAMCHAGGEACYVPRGRLKNGHALHPVIELGMPTELTLGHDIRGQCHAGGEACYVPRGRLQNGHALHPATKLGTPLELILCHDIGRGWSKEACRVSHDIGGQTKRATCHAGGEACSLRLLNRSWDRLHIRHGALSRPGLGIWDDDDDEWRQNLLGDHRAVRYTWETGTSLWNVQRAAHVLLFQSYISHLLNELSTGTSF
jgi:hypothetical protein